MIVYTLRAGRNMNAIAEEVDRETITMSDYTIRIKPKFSGCSSLSRQWSEYKVAGTRTKEAQTARLQKDLQEALESKISGSHVAEIAGKPAIWIAWDEDEQIELWRKQKVLLLQLEAALKASQGGRQVGVPRLVKEEGGDEAVEKVTHAAYQ
jgi:hypothetical protein